SGCVRLVDGWIDPDRDGSEGGGRGGRGGHPQRQGYYGSDESQGPQSAYQRTMATRPAGQTHERSSVRWRGHASGRGPDVKTTRSRQDDMIAGDIPMRRLATGGS